MSTNQIGSSRAGSAAEQGSPAQGLSSNHSALYSPRVSPALRKTVDADRLRKAKFFKPKPRPAIAPIAAAPEPEPIILTNPVSLREKIDIIRKIVAHEFGITAAKLMSRSQKHHIAHPRQLAMYFTIHILKRGYADTGRRFGRDHTTVMNAELAVIKRMADPIYAETIAKLRLDILTALQPNAVGQ